MGDSMDNNFYRQEKRRVSNAREKASSSPLNKIVIIQLVLSLLVTGVMYLACHGDGNLSKNIKAYYATICEKDMAVSDILDVVKKVSKVTFAPTYEWEDNVKNQGETNTEITGEKVSFSPFYLTVKFLPPLENGEISSHFGYRISPITNEYSFHTGIDLSSPKNSKIFTVYDGVVEGVGYNEISGNYVVIRHSKTLKTTYNHCNKVLVKQNEKVKKGDTIALVGSTGASTGNHLHFEVILDGKFRNPLWVMNFEN